VTLEPGDVVLSITWHPSGLGGRSGEARLSHLDGRHDRRTMDMHGAAELAARCFGDQLLRRELPGQGLEWTRATA
jgi:hypothetical protein